MCPPVHPFVRPPARPLSLSLKPNLVPFHFHRYLRDNHDKLAADVVEQFPGLHKEMALSSRLVSARVGVEVEAEVGWSESIVLFATLWVIRGREQVTDRLGHVTDSNCRTAFFLAARLAEADPPHLITEKLTPQVQILPPPIDSAHRKRYEVS